MPRRQPPPKEQVPLLGVTPAPDDEKSYEQLIRDHATRHGWMVMKVQKIPVVNGGKKFWRTPTSLKGWPDLTLIHPLGYLMFLEVKGSGGSPSPEQRVLMAALQMVASHSPRVEAAIVKPRDWTVIERLLVRPGEQVAAGATVGSTEPVTRPDGGARTGG